ncbi:DUF2911 domain-containing protein [Ekhidna sp. To15]|uniref:DUF2911 domain-containing protein n=1 Tax=Ekhidna sp. To15 TaxID=3395267 RepID=UPI003F51D2F1
MKKTQLLLIVGCIFCTSLSFGQFHTLKIPKASNHVRETQTLGVTDITLDYHSPATRGRDVWNNPNIIPLNGVPIAWRAGANMNTTISFSTDVMIQGERLPQGTYGFHVIPRGEVYDLIFAHNSNQWGSYYLDLKNDVTLTVEVEAEECPPSEKLDFEFLNWSENEVTIALEWDNRRLPFKVSVDLNETVVASFRSELRGINTYHWQAWNDAAQWCLNHDTNLDEAVEWANRSINGGFNGFASNKNITNLTTKAQLLNKLERDTELDQTISEISNMDQSANEVNAFCIFLLRIDKPEAALQSLNTNIKKYPDAWFLKLNRGLANYFLDNQTKALKELKAVRELTPDFFKQRMEEIVAEVEAGTYKIPRS